MTRPHPALEKTRDDGDGEWFLVLELNDDPQMVERTTEEIGPSEALALLMRLGLSSGDAQGVLASARRVFAAKH
jgi:hypothetical protein